MFQIGICDDERSTCGSLEDTLYEIARQMGLQFEVIVWYTGEELCKFLQKGNTVDILFLDIELITTNGIHIGNFIREELENLETAIVYISSTSSYAMDLFRIQPLDFLIKPLQKARISDVISRAIHQHERTKQLFQYQVRGVFSRLPCKDIMYFFSQNKKIIIVTRKANIEFNGKLKDVIQHVPHNFLLIHQSFLINLDYVSECSYETVTMQDGSVLNISQPYRKLVREQILQYQWEKTR